MIGELRAWQRRGKRAKRAFRCYHSDYTNGGPLAAADVERALGVPPFGRSRHVVEFRTPTGDASVVLFSKEILTTVPRHFAGLDSPPSELRPDFWVGGVDHQAVPMVALGHATSLSVLATRWP
jgi:hypothetical protein